MTESPDTIWTWYDPVFETFITNDHGDERYTADHATEYVSRSHCEALVAAAYEDAASRCQHAYDYESAPMVRGFDEAFQACAAHLKGEMEASTPAHAQTAYDTAIAKARANALGDVKDAADKVGYHCISCGHICKNQKTDLLMIRKAGSRSCCPEREMEPLSKAILTLIPETSDD